MKHTCTHLNDGVRSVHRLQIDGLSISKYQIMKNNIDCIKHRCSVDGYNWEIEFHPDAYRYFDDYWVALVLVFLGGAGTNSVMVDLSCRLVDQSSDLGGLRSLVFDQPMDRSDPVYLGRGAAPKGGSMTVEFSITVLRDPNGAASPPSSDLHRHLGTLLQNQAGADSTFMVSGESILAHKIILAARSPVFMAEFFGSMVERSSPCVEIQDMEPAVFKAMIHYIYTDTLPDLFDKGPEAEAADEEVVMVQNLLVAAGRYGLDRLKAICEHRLSRSVGVATVASTLALAEQHSCSQLKAKCVEFVIGRSSKAFEAVLATEGYRHLEASSPSVVTELLKAVHRKWEKSASALLKHTGLMS